ncbi:MAG: hypothetical protein AB7I50_26975, partial [Vicinamibacterales bacterium]
YELKQTSRHRTSEEDRPHQHKHIRDLIVETSRPIIFDSYCNDRNTGSFILVDPTTNFTAGAGMIVDVQHENALNEQRLGTAERLVQLARSAPTEAEAVDAVRRALEEMLT